jgi:hypothetical protein
VRRIFDGDPSETGDRLICSAPHGFKALAMPHPFQCGLGVLEQLHANAIGNRLADNDEDMDGRAQCARADDRGPTAALLLGCDARDVVAEALDFGIVPGAARLAQIRNGTHIGAMKRVRGDTTHQLDETVRPQLAPHLQPHQPFAGVDRIFRLHDRSSPASRPVLLSPSRARSSLLHRRSSKTCALGSGCRERLAGVDLRIIATYSQEVRQWIRDIVRGDLRPLRLPFDFLNSIELFERCSRWHDNADTILRFESALVLAHSLHDGTRQGLTASETMRHSDDKRNSSGLNQRPAAFPKIPGYRFLHTIARSMKSEIHVAHSEELGHNVAIKVLRTGASSTADAGEEERFERERELLMRIKHRAIVDVYDWGHGEDFRYIVTEYFPSGSLELRIRNLMTVKDSVDIFVQIAGALVAIHSAGLCHRDLKPANVMMRQDGRIVLIDFGLAKRVDGATHLTNAGEVRGSPYYISPEQAEGSPVDQRSDLYSLGVMFYEMLTGQRPFRGSTVIGIIQSHRNDPIPTLAPELNRFQRLIDGLLAKDPNERFPSAATALSELARMKV